MNARTIIGVASSLALTATIHAGSVSAFVEEVDPDAEGWTALGYDASLLRTLRVYAQFPLFSEAFVTSVGVLSDTQDFEVGSTDGRFVNAPLGTDFAPSAALAAASPELLWDTFVTIGETVAQGAGDLPNTFGAPSFGKTPGFAEQVDGLARCSTLDDTGWLVTGFPAHSQAVDGRVLLAQLTVFNTAGPYGYDWRISYVENGVPNSGDLSFGVIGAACGCVTDLNGDGGTGFADLSRLLTAWGECGLCPEDLDADGAVGFADLSEMLNGWGACV